MTTTTAAVIIEDALKENRILGEGETPTSAQYDDGLRMLNRLLDTFSNDADFAYYASEETRDLTGEESFTIGPTGDVVAPRPVAIQTATVVRDGITYPVQVIDNQRYDLITYKALSGANTQAIYYHGTWPDGEVFCFPLSTGCTLHMRVLNVVKQFADTTTQIDMPPGYEDYLMLALAIRMAPSYGATVSPDTQKAYHRARNQVEKTNRVIPTLPLPSAVLSMRGGTYADYMGGIF